MRRLVGKHWVLPGLEISDVKTMYLDKTMKPKIHSTRNDYRLDERRGGVVVTEAMHARGISQWASVTYVPIQAHVCLTFKLTNSRHSCSFAAAYLSPAS
jgi:hypothetical protein